MTNRVLRTLLLRDNGIREKGAVALIEALEVNTILRTLDIRKNGVGNGPSAMLAKADFFVHSIWGHFVVRSSLGHGP